MPSKRHPAAFGRPMKERLRRLDLFATRGVHPHHHQGLRMFWWDGLLATISGAFVDTYTTLYALALGATSTHIGMLSSASSFMGMLAPLPGAALVQKVGRRRPLIVGVSMLSRALILLAALLPFFFSGPAAITVLLGLFALRAGLNNLIHPAWVSMTGDVVPMEHRGRYFSTRNVSMAVASMLVVPLAGWLIGLIGSPQGYQVSLTLAFVIGLTSSYAYSRIPEPPLAAPAAGRRAAGPLAALRDTLRTSRVFVYFVAGMMVWTFGVQVAAPYFSVYQVDELGTSPSIIGMLTTISALTGIVGQRLWGRVIDRRGSRWVMGLNAFIIPILPVIWIFVRRPWQAAWISVLSGFFWAAFNIASFNLLLELPEAEQRTQAAAGYTTLVNMVSVVAPLVGGFVIERLGFHWAFGLSGVLRATGALMFFFLLKPFKSGKGQEAGGKRQEEAAMASGGGLPEIESPRLADGATENTPNIDGGRMTTSFWTLNDQQVFEAPGLAAMIFHDFYPEGKQGGLTLIQHGERAAACGDVRLEPAPGQWRPLPKVGERQADGAGLRVPAEFESAGIAYTVRVWPEGESLCVAVDLAAPLPPEWEGKLGFNLELYPGALFGKTFHLGTTAQLFPQQANGVIRGSGEENGHLDALAAGPTLTVAPEDPLRRLVIASEGGKLCLYDGRDVDANGWFVVRELARAGATTDAIRWRITLHSIPGWQRPPVIAVSQVGYHPDQVKQAILELDARTDTLDTAVLKRLDADGFTTALADTPARWGRWLCYEYAIFDFTAVREPGMYVVRYGDQSSPPFAIHPEVYRHNVWQPTLETYFPVQMCHMEVRDKTRVWHGACHLDDALQAPAPHVHFDGYHQYDATDTPYAPGAHIPHLDVGGWHDAGDYDLAAGSQARTTHALCLIRELFGVDTDRTTVKQAERLALLHTPDGVPDIVEQVAHGALSLLSGYRATAHTDHPHSFHGIIEATVAQYAHLGDAATMTDNRIYDPALAPGQIRCDAEGHVYASRNDDRWAFTNHDSALEYMVAAALAASSRVLRGYEDALADECLQTALRVWEYEQAHAPVAQPAAYVPRGVEAQEVVAAVELLLTTGEARFRERLLTLQPTFEWTARWVGGAIARAVSVVDDADFTARFRAALEAGQAEFAAALASNPFGIHWQPHVWGVGWQIQQYAVEMYQIWQIFPDLVDREVVLRVVNYVLGCHPASNLSLTSGVGAESVMAAYGVNRGEWSYIPGGMISGVSLIRPDFPELKAPWPFLWQQTEYVMPGAANYIFCVLAADALLNPEA